MRSFGLVVTSQDLQLKTSSLLPHHPQCDVFPLCRLDLEFTIQILPTNSGLQSTLLILFLKLVMAGKLTLHMFWPCMLSDTE